MDKICHRWKSFETNLLGRHHFEHIRHSLIVAVHWSIVYRKVLNFVNFTMTCFFFPRTYDYREPMNLERKLKSFLSTIMFHRTFNHSLFSVSSFKMFYLIKQEFLKNKFSERFMTPEKKLDYSNVLKEKFWRIKWIWIIEKGIETIPTWRKQSCKTDFLSLKIL